VLSKLPLFLGQEFIGEDNSTDAPFIVKWHDTFFPNLVIVSFK